MSSYSERLREALNEAGINPTELARRVGVRQQSVEHLLKKDPVGSAYTVQIALELGVGAYWLATGRGPKRPWEDGTIKPLAESMSRYSTEEIRRVLTYLSVISATPPQEKK